MNIDFDRLKYSLTGEYEEVMLEKQLEEKDKELERYKNIIDELEKDLTPDYKEYKNLIDKRDYLTDINDNYWLGVAETSEYVLNKLKELKGE